VKEHPRNSGTSQIDFVMLLLIPGAIVALSLLIAYMGMTLE